MLALGAHQFDNAVNAHFAGNGAVGDFFFPGKVLWLGPVAAPGGVTMIVARTQDQRQTAHKS